jgi:hypothetical protein
LVHVVEYQLSPNATTHHQVLDDIFGYSVLVCSTLPEIIFVKLLGKDTILDLELPPGIVDIHPILEQDVTINLPNRRFIISIEQIPIVPAFALTINKFQGLTLSSIILGPLLHPSRKTPKKNGTLYVALIRIKRLSNLYILEPLSPTILRYFQPSNSHLTKDKCLQALEPSF